jgi:hypothetical protein
VEVTTTLNKVLDDPISSNYAEYVSFTRIIRYENYFMDFFSDKARTTFIVDFLVIPR